MLENRCCKSCLVFTSSCQRGRKWAYMYHGKRPREFTDSDGCPETKLSKLSSDDSSSDNNNNDDTCSPQDSDDLVLPDSPDQSHDDGKRSSSSSDMDSSLIHHFPIALGKSDLDSQSDNDSLSGSVEESLEEQSEEDDGEQSEEDGGNDKNDISDSPEEDGHHRHAEDSSSYLDALIIPIELDNGDNFSGSAEVGHHRHAGDSSSDLDALIQPIGQDNDDNNFSGSEEDGHHRHAGDSSSDLDALIQPIGQDNDENNFSSSAEDGHHRHAGDSSSDLDALILPIRRDNDDNFSGHAEDGHHRHAGDSSSDLDALIQPIGRDNSISCLIKCSRSDYGSIAMLNRSFRSLIRSGEIYKLRRQNGVFEHWVYFSCHLLQWEAFDPIRHRWMHLPRMPPNECFIFSDKESLAVGTELLVFGKEVTSQVIYRYSILTNSWTSGTSMNAPRCLFGSASLGEIAILAGGCDSQGSILSSAEMYNSETQKWETLPSMNKPRKMCSGVFMDKKFYVIGGIGGNDALVLTCGEEYDLETKKWTEIPNMSPGRSRVAAEMPAAAVAPPLVAVVNNELYAADHAAMEVKKYDKEANSWLTIGRLPERAVSMNGWGLAFRACGDRLVVIGGPRALGEGFIELNSWVPSEGPPEWNLLARKQLGNFVYNCAVMGC